jgi:hypothetical protein
MAVPTSDYNELHPIYTTYKAAAGIVWDRTKVQGSTSTGLAVKKTATDREVDLVADGDRIAGLLKKVEPDNFCTVHEGMYIELPDDGTAINNGDFVCGGAVAGKIRAVGAATHRNAQKVAAGPSGAGFHMIRLV